MSGFQTMMERHMTISYSKWDVVVIPFPFVKSSKTKPRPALILSKKSFNDKHGHAVLLMITTATNTKWSTDVNILNIDHAGLPVPSYIRMKFFTLDCRLIKKVIGSLSKKDRETVSAMLNQNIF